MIDWAQVRRFIHRQTYFCTMGVYEKGAVRLFPIGSLRFSHDGVASYLELYARPVEAGTPLTCLAVNVSPWFWISSLLRGRFLQPVAVRLEGCMGVRREASDCEKAKFRRAVGWLGHTRGGRLLWPDAKYSREVMFHRAQALRLGRMTRGLEHWAEQGHPPLRPGRVESVDDGFSG